MKTKTTKTKFATVISWSPLVIGDRAADADGLRVRNDTGGVVTTDGIIGEIHMAEDGRMIGWCRPIHGGFGGGHVRFAHD